MTERRPRWVFVAGDPLRGVGMLGVLIAHAGVVALAVTGQTRDAGLEGLDAAYDPVLVALMRVGFFGLWVFFGLSGYLIGKPFVLAIVEGRPLPSIALFARRRALRILPAYWTVLTIVLVVFAGLLGQVDASAGQFARLLAFDTSGNPARLLIAQAWSLGVEARFYIVLPLAAVLIAFGARRLRDPRTRALVIAVPCLLWLLAAPFLIQSQPPLHSLVYFARIFGAGIALAALEPFLQPLVAGKQRWATLALALTLAALAYVLAFPELPYQLAASFQRQLADLGMGVVATTLIAAPLLRQWVDGGCWTALDNRWTRWLGSRSYSFYLVHLVVLYELADAFADDSNGYKTTMAWLLPAGFVVSALLSELLYRTVERPFLSRRRRIVEEVDGLKAGGRNPLASAEA